MNRRCALRTALGGAENGRRGHGGEGDSRRHFAVRGAFRRRLQRQPLARSHNTAGVHVEVTLYVRVQGRRGSSLSVPRGAASVSAFETPPSAVRIRPRSTVLRCALTNFIACLCLSHGAITRLSRQVYTLSKSKGYSVSAPVLRVDAGGKRVALSRLGTASKIIYGCLTNADETTPHAMSSDFGPGCPGANSVYKQVPGVRTLRYYHSLLFDEQDNSRPKADGVLCNQTTQMK